MAEILIDQGRRQEARKVLSRAAGHNRGEQISPVKRYPNRRSTGADEDYKKMLEMAQAAAAELDRYRRAEDWDRAREVGQELYGIHPSYFDLNEPMDRFNQVRRILNNGVLKEIEADEAEASNATLRSGCLSEALEIYNHGCYASEVYHEFFDPNEATISGFDHSDCANIFFSAARICYKFDTKGLLDSSGNNVTPRLFQCKGPNLTCSDWKHQALHFLEKGRARALLSSIIRGGVVTDIPRNLIKRTAIKGMATIADAASQVLKKRGSSVVSSATSSRAPSVSPDISVSQVATLRETNTTLQSRDRSHSDTLDKLAVSPSPDRCTKGDQQGLTLQTSNLSNSAVQSLVSSPAGARTPILTKDEESRVKARINWRRYLLWALAQVNPALGAALPIEGGTDTIEIMRASIPSDTLVVEYALVSAAPCGIMVIVAASDGVKAVEWKKINTVDIQKYIGDLRASMEIPVSVTEPERRIRQTAPSKPTDRPSGPVRQLSATDQKRLDELFQNVVVVPVTPHLEGKEKLIIVPSGDLAHVPWTIFFPRPITVVPSLKIWTRLQAQADAGLAAPTKISIVSTEPEDKEMKKNNEPGYLRNIPFSRIEALYLARLHDQFPFLADDKDRRALEKLAEGTHILHICAHSTFEPEAPMSSSLELFKEPLTILDWHKLSIKAELVVFSSCLSGISKAYDSRSTIGFAHTLLGTGTKAFIGSLWRVDDRATLLLMMMFYEELQRPLPVADALFEAQKRMRNLTDEDLANIIDKLQYYALGDGGIYKYVINPGHHFTCLRETKASDWREKRYWAAFVLTRYGSRNIYPAKINDDQ